MTELKCRILTNRVSVIKTTDEQMLCKFILINGMDASNDYQLNGSMKKENIKTWENLTIYCMTNGNNLSFFIVKSV